MADINTLVDDIYGLFTKPRDFNKENTEEFGRKLAQHISNRINEERGAPTLRLSNLGMPDRKLWYTINLPQAAEPLRPEVRVKFLFGDILEELLLFLAKEAGHTVEGQQDTIKINGVVGHRDGVIDGRVVDTKSASTFGFKKFASNGLRDDDPFNYMVQLGTYLDGSKEEDIVTDKNVASFLAIDKQHGHIVLDTYEFPEYNYKQLVNQKRDMLMLEEPPERCYEDIPEGKSGNRKLDTACSYCPFKETCWPNLRTFLYSRGPVFLTHVALEPKVPELNKDEFYDAAGEGGV